MEHEPHCHKIVHGRQEYHARWPDHTGRQFLLRGEEGARGEWRLLAACHNLRKIFRHTGTAGLATLTA